MSARQRRLNRTRRLQRDRKALRRAAAWMAWRVEHVYVRYVPLWATPEEKAP